MKEVPQGISSGHGRPDVAARPGRRMLEPMSNVAKRRGFNLVEGIVVVAILSFFVLALVTTLPRRREVARRAVCQKKPDAKSGSRWLNYDRAGGHLPLVPPLESEASQRSGPLKARLLETLDLPDLSGCRRPREAIGVRRA